MASKGFTERIDVRLTPEQLSAVNRISERYAGMWESNSHFARCAVIKMCREYGELVEKNKMFVE